MGMRIVIGADHGGFDLKETIKRYLSEKNHTVVDIGTHSSDAVDYPDYTYAAARKILSGDAEVGIVVCGSGVGACVAANKIKGIRAGMCHDTFSARQSREDDDANMLCLGARVVGYRLAFDVVDSFINARFSGAERHRRRLAKVANLESGEAP
jgi:RpiB/LacA/LacB family sugar-phosphate isomerase